jgi:TonB family protein
MNPNSIDQFSTSLDALETQEPPVKVRSLARLRLDRELNGLYHADRRKQNTMIGSASALAVLLLLLFVMNILDITPYTRREERKTIPIQLLQYGVVGSREANKGNLSQEGKATKAAQSPELLADAAKINAPTAKTTPTPPPQTAQTLASNTKPREYTQPSYVKPVQDEKSPKAETSQDKSSQDKASSAKTAVGSEQGSTAAEAEGIGRFGAGTGRGEGYGLEWGGGGNRVVLHKELPKYPSGVNTTTQIKMRFTVNPNGTVAMILPMQKGDPLLERAAIQALRRWQFNPLNDTKEMVGFITFTFRIQ